jgi:hypothetical protein
MNDYGMNIIREGSAYITTADGFGYGEPNASVKNNTVV